MTIFRLRDCVTTAFEADRKLHHRDEVDVTPLPSRAELEYAHRHDQFERCRSAYRAVNAGVIATLVCMGLWMAFRGMGL